MGPACLTLEVCHGDVQLPAADGSSCCHENEHCAATQGDDDGPAVAARSECAACYDIELAASDEPIEAPGSLDCAVPLVLVAQVVQPVFSSPHGTCVPSCDARAPPGATTPTGLLPGAFPLRI